MLDKLTDDQYARVLACHKQVQELSAADVAASIDNPAMRNSFGTLVSSLIAFHKAYDMSGSDPDAMISACAALGVFGDDPKIVSALSLAAKYFERDDYLNVANSPIVAVNSLEYKRADGSEVQLTNVYVYFGERDDIGRVLYSTAASQQSPKYFANAAEAESGDQNGPYLDLATAMAAAGL